MANWEGKITSSTQLIDMNANENGNKAMQDAVKELRAIADRLQDIADDCGDEAMAATIGWAGKLATGTMNFLRKVAPWNWGKEIVNSDPEAESMKNYIEDAVELINSFADTVEKNAGDLYAKIRSERYSQEAALTVYQAQQKKEAENQGGGNNG